MTTTKQPGLASATSPHAVAAVHTPEEHIIAGGTSILSQGENMSAYHTRPKNADGPLPIAIVVQEIFGVHERIRDLCRRLAQEGYLAIASELYFRQGDPNEYHDIPTLPKELATKMPSAQVLANLDHVASWAACHGGGAHRLLITGFYWDGYITWLYTAHNPQLKAGVAWYGKLVGEKSLNSPKRPVDITVDLSAPVLDLCGAEDASIPQNTVGTMRQTLRAANATAEIVVYPETDHIFNANYRASYHEESAKDGWRRVLAWFVQHSGKKAQSPNA